MDILEKKLNKDLSQSLQHLNRILMLIKDEPNLREVQAFPPSASGQDLMMGSPSELTKEQLRELNIKFDIKEEDK